ncbi:MULTISPECIES: TetR/AcrR family transcriptional regulator [unclassified Saccharothrix]|uniref:TetR/AcrR family transcriptional regulator n=1 Tax=unclassified Saccharothrix TaxID=2593673 RepID=UPI00307DC626
MSIRPPLRQRKAQRARDQIVAAAFELFAERGFADVTVADIAERAEVGRTTFFRYFGDKQEVVFSEEQAIMDDWVTRHRALPPVATPDDTLAQTREFALVLCREMTADREHFVQHERLLEANPELNDRAMRKYQRLVEAMSENLRAKGTPEPTATLVPQLALACYRTARRVAGLDPVALPAALDAAFDHLTALSPTR